MRVSPSQISAFRGCQRRWYLRSILGVVEPTSPAQELGLDVHAAIEQALAAKYGLEWSVDRVPSEQAKGLASVALEAAAKAELLLEDRLPVIEGGISWAPEELADVATLAGRLDLYWPATLHDDAIIVDWKTRSSLAYAPTPEQLLDDPQVIVYGSAALEEQGNQGTVKFVHVNVATRTGEWSVVEVLLDDFALCNGRLAVYRDVQAMADLAGEAVTADEKQERLELAKANYSHCKAYGGCPHAVMCSQRPDWPHKERPMDSRTLTERLASRRTINPPDAEPVPPRPVASSTAAPTPPAWPAPEVPPVAPAQRRILLLGCAPLVGVDGAVWADRWLAPMADEVAQRNGVAHFSLVEYGRGKAELVGMVAALVRSGSIPRTLVLDRRTALGEAVVDVLSPAYDVVIGRLG